MRMTWLLLLPSVACADIYRWVDSQGQVHFDQRPNASAQKVEVKPQIVERDELTIEREQRTQRVYDARREEQAQERAVVQEQQVKRTQQCMELRSKLAGLSHGGRFFKQQADGERSYYSDDQIEAAREQLQQRIAQQCP